MQSAVAAATCDLCGKRFENAYQLGPHKKVCWPSWIDKNIFSPEEFSCSSEEEEEVRTIEVATSAVTSPTTSPRQQVAPSTTLWQLARRDKFFGTVQRVILQGTGLFNADFSFDYVAVSLLAAIDCLILLFLNPAPRYSFVFSKPVFGF